MYYDTLTGLCKHGDMVTHNKYDEDSLWLREIPTFPGAPPAPKTSTAGTMDDPEGLKLVHRDEIRFIFRMGED